MADIIAYESHVFASPKFKSVVKDAIAFFKNTPVYALPPPSPFVGSGVYALYYTGAFEWYKPLSELNRSQQVQPIYVGKAVPPGWRTGRILRTDTRELYRRLQEHANSILASENLQVKDFFCRFMILKDIEADLIVPAEAQLIRIFTPLWNTAVDGFGNHDPGKGRYNQAPSEWDILHPGRVWTKRLTGVAPILARIHQKIERNFEKLQPA